MNSAIRCVAASALLCLSSFALAAPASQGQWVYPIIKGYGGVHPLPHAAVQPDSHATYKAFFYISWGSDKPSDVNPGLVHVARAVNVMSEAGVPLSHLHYVALIHEKAIVTTLKSRYYHLRTGADNPNVQLLHELHEAGVKLLVCGQALAGAHMKHAWVDPDVEVSLSALSDQIIYGDKGYAFVHL